MSKVCAGFRQLRRNSRLGRERLQKGNYDFWFHYDIIDFFNPDINRWLSNQLLNFSPDDVVGIRLEYAQKPDRGFMILKDSLGKLALYDPEGLDLSSQSNSSDVADYLYSFAGISYADDPGSEFTVYDKNAWFTLWVTTRHGRTVDLSAFVMINRETGESHPSVFWGITNDHDGILLKYSDFDPILLPIDYFLKK